MVCNKDCFNCPYNDCILPDKAHLSPYNPEAKKNYYQANKVARIAYQRAYNKNHKDRSKKRWASMTEEQKEIERAKARERYRKRHEKLNGISERL